MSSHRPTPPYPYTQTGFSLVEVMVSMVLGLILLAGITTLVVGASASNNAVERVARQLDSGRYASETLANHIRHAGYYGSLYPVAAINMPALPAALPNACSSPATAAGLTANMPIFIQGEDAPAGDPAADCITDADHVDGTDIVAIRRSSTVNVAVASVDADTLYLQTAPTEFAIDTGANASTGNDGFGVRQLNAAGNPVAADIRAFQVDIFYLSPRTRPVSATACDGNADTGDPIPTLMRMRLVDNGYCAEAIAAGIQNLQLEYGIDTSGNGTPNQYEEQPDNPLEWSNVMGVRVYLLARSEQAIAEFNDTKSYTLGEGGAGPNGTDTYGPFNDDFSRHVFTTTVRLVNPSGRRETP